MLARCSARTRGFILPWAAVFAISVITILEFLFLGFAEPLTGLPWLQPTADDGMVVAKRSMLDSVDGRWIIVGDSSALHGLRPDILVESGGIDAVNLGTLSSLTTSGFTEMAIEAMTQGDVAGVIYAILPQSLEVGEIDAADFGQLDRYLSAYGSHLGLRSIPLRARLDHQLRRHRINKFPPQFEGSVNGLEEKLREHSGYYPERKNESLSVAKQKFVAREFSVRAIEAAADYSSKAGVPFTLLLMPKPHSSVSEDYTNGVREFMDRMVHQSPQLHVVPAQWQTLSDDLFGTETHLSEKGAEFYSRRIGKLLADVSRSGR